MREYRSAAERLAAHRGDDGLRVEVVDVEDVFDEFAHGRFERAAVADFVEHIYRAWSPRPACRPSRWR